MRGSIAVILAVAPLLAAFGQEKPAVIGPWPAASTDGCVLCHDMPAAATHPLGVPVGGIRGLPSGPMGCLTCHDERATRRHRGAGPMLRLPQAGLCATCHVAADESSRLAHGLRLGQAHLVEPPAAAKRTGPDRESRSCLACHDGSAARTAPRTEAGGDRRRGHPIGIDYQSSADAPRAHLVPADLLPREVRLPEGKVGCGSCHSAYSRREDMLVRDRSRSALCLSCHDL